MTAAGRQRRWGFRARLTALIAAVFVVGGVALLSIQYLLVQQLFNSAIGTIATGCADADGVSVATDQFPDVDAACQAVTEITGASDGAVITADSDGHAILIQQSAMISEEVLTGLLFWSVITLIVFAGVAVIAASWLARRSFARIAQITETTQRITRDDLSTRLDLPGPDDEIKELGDTIDTMLDRLSDSFAKQGRFIANASHELRTPLTTTRTALEIPLEQGLVPNHLEAPIRRALDANERSEQLIAALLNLARSTTTRSAPPDEHDLAQFLRRSVTRHRPDAEERGVSVAVDAEPATVSGVDETLLDLTVGNLVDNAIRHNIPGGHVHASTGTAGGGAWLEVSNSGPRLSAEEVRLLKEPFNRGAGTRIASGQRSLGLGLTLVENVVTSHGGDLILTPLPEGGIAARIQFPAPQQR